MRLTKPINLETLLKALELAFGFHNLGTKLGLNFSKTAVFINDDWYELMVGNNSGNTDDTTFEIKPDLLIYSVQIVSSKDPQIICKQATNLLVQEISKMVGGFFIIIS